MADFNFRENTGENRFELWQGDSLAGHADYRRSGKTVTMTHTEVGPQFEGKGVGSKLARQALDAVRNDGHTVVPRCSFIAAWIERHPDYQDLVTSSDEGLQ